MYLIHDGTTRRLSDVNGDGAWYGTDAGGSGHCDDTFTVFDDAATTKPIDDGSASSSPFDSGPYAPEESLSAFNDKLANGLWQLKIGDDTGPNGQVGTLLCWRLEITVATADLVVSLTDGPDPTSVGNELTYTATVKNNGPVAATNAKLQWSLPIGAELISATASDDAMTCNTTKSPLVCALGNLAKDATATVTVVVKPASIGMASATATASSEAVDVDNTAGHESSATTTTTVQETGSGGTHTITVDTLGTGRGVVTSDPEGIDCGNDCEGGYLQGTAVTLTATPNDGSTVAAWGGACEGTAADQSCVVTADGAKTVTVTFDKAQSGGGSGGSGGGSGGSGGSGASFDICTITGTSGTDVLKGTKGSDVICGFGGNDKLYGLGGADRLYGGGGNDKLFGGPGRDKLYGGPGRDTLAGGKGADKARSDVRDSLSSVEGQI
jgi:uncharacterized repeat protein (TIGR01451 family)